jgi:hypothetical protein
MNTNTALGTALKTCTFRKGAEKGYCLIGIPAELEEQVLARLFVLRCKLIAHYQGASGTYIAVNFEAPAAIAARFALIFPAPKDAEPLLVNREGTRIVGGKAAQACDVQRQRLIGEPMTKQRQLA